MRFFLGDIELSNGILSKDEASGEFYFVPTKQEQKDLFYTVIVVDLNNGVSNSFLHCLVTNVRAKDEPNGDILVPYIPIDIPYHRYTFSVYSSTKPLSNLRENDRSRFDIETFVRGNGLLLTQKAIIINIIPRHIDPEDEENV